MRIGEIDEAIADRVFPGAGKRAGATPRLARLDDAAWRGGHPSEELNGDETRHPRHDRSPVARLRILAPAAPHSTTALASADPTMRAALTVDFFSAKADHRSVFARDRRTLLRR